jgi:GcrA cell cycle regulator
MRPGEARVSWSDEAVETAKRLSAGGMSAGQIARAMSAEHPGITRNSVIGKLHRVGLAGGGRRPNRDKRSPFETLPALRPTSPDARVGRGVRVRSEKRGNLIERDTAAPESKWISIVDLEPTSCRWPRGEPSDPYTFAYCGAQIEPDHSYCPYHCGLAYVGTAAAYAKATERNQWLMKA